MATTLPTVTVTRIEAGNGLLIRCNRCPQLRLIRRDRYTADLAAADHRASHGRIDPADHTDDQVVA